MQKKGLFDIGERSFYTETDGSGVPTIVIEVGSTMAGTKDPGWFSIRDELAQDTSVFLYDRANLGQSGLARLPRTLDDFTSDLQSVLQVARVDPPYLLVGASLGGMLAIHFASLHPQEVCGVIVLDPPHPEVNLRTLALLPAEQPDEPHPLAAFRKLAWQEQYSPLEAPESEGLDMPAAITQSKAAWNLRDIPLVVMTAGINEWEEQFPASIAKAYEMLWLDLHKEMAALSTYAAHRIVDDSYHLIHECRPDLVLETVRTLIGSCRQNLAASPAVQKMESIPKDKKQP